MDRKTRLITTIAIMSALSFAFYAIEFSVGFLFPLAPFLKIDPSDIPCILISFAFGPKSGILVALIKNILHISISKDPSLSGEIANFCYCLTFLIPFILYKKNKKQLPLIYTMSIISSTLAMCFVNYFITLPLYGISNKVQLIIEAFIPFNIFKGVLLTLVTLMIYPKIIKLVEKE